jgi:hypothetical protein
LERGLEGTAKRTTMRTISINKASVHSFFSDLSHEDVSVLFLYLLVILYPILPGYFGFFGFTVYSIIAACSLVFVPFSQKIRNFRFNSKTCVLLLFIVPMICLGPLVNGEGFTPTFLNYLNAFILLPFYVSVVGSDQKIFERCISLMLGAACVLCLFSFLELLNFNIFSLLQNDMNTNLGPETGKRFGIYRSESSFGQSIAFAIYLNFMVCLLFYKIRKQDSSFSVKYFLLFLLFNACCLLTLSRFPIIVMAMIDVFGFFFCNKKFKTSMIATLVLCLFGEILFSIVRGGSVFSSLVENLLKIISGTAGTDPGDNPLLYRSNLFSALADVLGGNWLLGNGMLNQYSFLYPKTAWPTVRNSFDNAYLYFIENFGVIGLTGWLAYYVLPLFLNFGNSPLQRQKKTILILLVVVLFLNFISVARLAENKSFSLIFGLIIGQSLGTFSLLENRSFQSFRRISI